MSRAPQEKLTKQDLRRLEEISAQQRQLDAWVAGKPEHNTVVDECCPDFSCCQPALLAPEHERKAFAAADEDTRMQMLGGFLGRAVAEASADKSVYIAGQDPEPEQKH